MAQSNSLGSTKRPKVSAFVEVGLFDDEEIETRRAIHMRPKALRRPPQVRFRSNASIIPYVDHESEWETVDDSDHSDIDEISPSVSSRQSSFWTSHEMYRMGMLLLLLAVALPIVQTSTLFGSPGHVMLGAKGGVIRERSPVVQEKNLVDRANSPTDVCKRWSHQTALVNGTLYIYGGRASTDPNQQDNTWNNDFLTLDLTKTWQISTPSLTGLPQPSGPPAVANGYLWNSYNSLYLYGGEFSDTPATSPVPFSLWEYNLANKQWKEHSNPQTSSGNNSEGAGQPVQRAAEGAGFSVASIGRGWYFGGHLDGYTTQGWSQSIPRVYIKSLVEYTFPGAKNNEVDTLSSGQTAGSDGVWRNITQGGVQDTAGFPERADGILAYIPGYSENGILLGLTGGTNNTFTQMNVIDVYDIATSTWYKQSTSGKTPQARVNPCVTVAAAPDGTSYNLYMFGGQNLVPYKEQIQYDDMWILTMPSFTWIQVQSDSQVPPPRAGHSCNIWDGQMIVVGGYVGQDLSCDSPGVYVFNMSSLKWENQFTALTGDQSRGKGNGDAQSNPLSQQSGQLSQGNPGKGGLEGSYGYQVPDAVASVVGGGPTGGATVSTPVQSPTGGPLATGKPMTYTVTASGGTVTQTAYAGGAGGAGGKETGSGRNIVAIIVGVIAGIFGIIAIYFAFCAWVYRKQLQLYKNHELMAHRAAANNAAAAEKSGLFPPIGSSKNSSDHNDRTGSAGGSGAGAYASGAGGSQARPSYDRRSSVSSTEDLLAGQEPSFWGVRGVLLNPRRSLRVINRD